MKTINEAIVDRLLKYLGEKGLSQYRLAQLSYVPYSTIRSIMQNRCSGISLKTTIMLSQGLGVPLHEFLDEKIFNVENLDIL